MIYEWDVISHNEYRKEDPSRVCTCDGPQSANKPVIYICTCTDMSTLMMVMTSMFGMFVLMMLAVTASLSCESLRLTSSRLPPEVLLKELPKLDRR